MTAYNKVWFHTGAPCNGCTGIGQMYDALEAKGIPFGVCSVNGGGLAAEAVRYSMAQTIIYRDLAYDYVPYHVEPTAAAATDYWKHLRDALPPEVRVNKDRVWIEVFNEPDRERPELVARWQYELALAAIADGYRFCGPGWASGTPEPEAWRGPWMQKYLRLCAERPERVAVTLHEYSYEAANIKDRYPYLIGRYRLLHEACDELGIVRPTIFITETGWTLNDMPAMNLAALTDINWLAREYAPHPNIRAAFLWSLIGGGDKKMLAQRLNGLIRPLTEYALTTRFDGEPPAPTPTPPPVPKPQPPPPTNPPAAVNLLSNGDFAKGWKDSDDWPMTTQDPTGWLSLWNATSGDDYRNEYAPEQPYLVGEAIHKGRAHVPAAEHDDFFADDNEWTYKVFAASRPIWFRLKTSPALELPAGRYTLAFEVFTDTYHWRGGKVYEEIEPHHTQTMVKANGRTIRDWTPLAAGRDHTVETTFDHAGGQLELAVHLRCNWGIASNNLWLKRLRLTAATVEQPPVEPKPEPPPVEPPPPAPPPQKPVLLLDISKWQGQIDPAKMKAAGVDGVMLRASYATNTGSRPDEKADEFAAKLTAAGVPFGWYHYFHPDRPVAEQFAAFRGVVERHGYKLRLALDLEEREGVNAITAAKAREFLSLMQAAWAIEGKHLVYTGLGYWRDTLSSPAWGAEFDLWLAAWTTAATPAVPKPWTTWTLWQHTSDGDGPAHGVGSARVDLNRFNGDRAAFGRWLAQGATQPPPVEPLANALWAHGQTVPSLAWNPAFALAAAILKDGYHVISGEYDFSLGGVAYKCQNAADDNGKRRVYYCVVPRWSDVRHIDGPATTPPTPKPPTTPPPSGTVVNLERAFRPIAVAAGQEARGPFMVYQHADGRTEDAQYLMRGSDTYLIKGSNYEHMWVDSAGIYRHEDTSHGDATYYTLSDDLGAAGSLWLPREMEIGRPFRREPLVTFRRKSDCAILYAGPTRHPTWAVIDSHMAQATLPGGLKVTSVIDLYVGSGQDAKGTWFERYWYALGTAGADGRREVRGLVQWWARNDQGQIVAHSWLVDLPQGRAPLPLVKPKCL